MKSATSSAQWQTPFPPLTTTSFFVVPFKSSICCSFLLCYQKSFCEKLTLSSSGRESHHSARFESRQTTFIMHKNKYWNTPWFEPPCLLWGQEAFVVQVCWIYTPFTSPFLLLICYLPPPPSHTLYPLLYFFSSVVEWVFREMVECVCWISLHCNPQDCTAPGKDLQCKHTCRWMDNPHSFVP